MMRKWIIVDVSHLCYRAMYTTGFMSHKGRPTGAIFGLLRDVRTLEEFFDTNDFVFAFDSEESKRKEKCPWYKANRDTDTDQYGHAQTRKHVREQAQRLKDELLPIIGYKNLFWQDGYEADDVIASVVACLGNNEKAMIVSADSDLFQLLSPGVKQVNMKNLDSPMTEMQFKNFYRCSPFHWPKIKAIAGDRSDNITGVEGVAEQTAAKFVGNVLGQHTYTYRKIEEFIRTDLFQENLKLVTIPWPGCAKYRPACHSVPGPDGWTEALKMAGIKSLNVSADALETMERRR